MVAQWLGGSAAITSIFLFLLPTLLLLMRRASSSSSSSKPLRSLKLPPGPGGLPIIGCLHKLGKELHKDIHELSKQHGPIMLLRLGTTRTVVVSSPEMAEQVLKTHGINFASRPTRETFGLITGNKGLGFSAYSPSSRAARKLCVSRLLNSSQVETIKPIRDEEVALLIRSLGESAASGSVVNLSDELSTLVAGMISRMLFGRKCLDGSGCPEYGEQLRELLREVMRLLGAFNVGDYLPFLRPLDLQGLRRRARRVMRPLNAILDRIIDEHMEKKRERKQIDFIDHLIATMESGELRDIGFDRSNIRAIIIDILEGGIDSTPMMVAWAFSELLRNRRIMKKLQEELDRVVITASGADEADLKDLEYLQMVVKETFRLHPSAAFVPRSGLGDGVTIGGYDVPRHYHVFINLWTIGRDPAVWGPDAAEFRPERFGGAGGADVRGHDFCLLPFGSGARVCPGMMVGLTSVQLVLARLVQAFDWEMPKGMKEEEIDMTEKMGLFLPRAKPLWLVPVARKHL